MAGPTVGLLLVVVVLLVLGGTSSATPAAPDGENVTAYQATTGEFDSATTVARGIENGSISRAEDVVLGDTLVVAIESDRLADELATKNGTTTARFFDVLDGNATFRLIQTNPTPERSRILAGIDETTATVHRRGSSTYVLVDTGNLTFHHRGHNRSTEIFGDERFIVQFAFTATADPEIDVGSSSRDFRVMPFKSRLYTNRYTYDPLAPEWVQVAVEVEAVPEHNLDVEVLVNGTRTIRTALEPIEDPGIANAWLDLRGLAPGSSYRLSLVHDGLVTDRYSGTVTPPSAVLRNVTLAEVSTEHVVTRDGQRVTETIHDHAAVNATVRLSHGGKVQVLDENCEPIGFAWVEPGETGVSMALWRDATPLRNVTEDDFGFVVRALRNQGTAQARYHDGTPVVAKNLDGHCPAPERQRTPTATAMATTAPPPTSGSTTTESPTSMKTPGSATAAAPIVTTTVTTEVTRTITPGQPGFTSFAAVWGLLWAVLWWRRSG